MNFDLALFEATLSKSIRAWGLSCSQEALDLMGQFALQIIEVNQGLNLTRILEPEEMAIKNFLDSLSLLLMEWVRVLDFLGFLWPCAVPNGHLSCWTPYGSD